MKKVIMLISLASLTLVYSCQKNREFKNEDGQASEDNQAIQAQTDEAVNDANGEVAKVGNMTGKAPYKLDGTLLGAPVCGLTVDTTGASQGTITLNYDGVKVCNNRKRSGSIKLTIQGYANGTRWNDAGCVLQLDYINYKVTRASDSKSIEFNGTHYITNVSGGNAITLIFGLQPTLVHSVTGTSLSVKFSDGSNATWNIHRQVTYTYDAANVIITAKCEGIGSYNGISQLENWGTTRKGDEFTSQVTVPVVWNTTCGANAPVEGQLLIKVDSKEFELKCTLGVDNSGTPVPITVNNCPYGMKVEWSHKNKNKEKIIAYK